MQRGTKDGGSQSSEEREEVFYVGCQRLSEEESEFPDALLGNVIENCVGGSSDDDGIFAAMNYCQVEEPSLQHDMDVNRERKSEMFANNYYDGTFLSEFLQ